MTITERHRRKPANTIRVTTVDHLEDLLKRHGGRIIIPDDRAGWATLTCRAGRFVAWVDAPLRAVGK